MKKNVGMILIPLALSSLVSSAFAEFHGADSGPIVRHYGPWGATQINTCVTIPNDLIMYDKGELKNMGAKPDVMFNPHLYTGFDFRNKANVEAGLQFKQTESSKMVRMEIYVKAQGPLAEAGKCHRSINDQKKSTGAKLIEVTGDNESSFYPGDLVCSQTLYHANGTLEYKILPTSKRANGTPIAPISVKVNCGQEAKPQDVRPRVMQTIALRRNSDGDQNIFPSNEQKAHEFLGKLRFKADWKQIEFVANGKIFGVEETQEWAAKPVRGSKHNYAICGAQDFGADDEKRINDLARDLKAIQEKYSQQSFLVPDIRAEDGSFDFKKIDGQLGVPGSDGTKPQD